MIGAQDENPWYQESQHDVEIEWPDPEIERYQRSRFEHVQDCPPTPATTSAAFGFLVHWAVASLPVQALIRGLLKQITFVDEPTDYWREAWRVLTVWDYFCELIVTRQAHPNLR